MGMLANNLFQGSNEGTQHQPFKGNILVVDDTKENLDMLTSLLSLQGYLARPVPNGEMALKACEIDPPELILLDINMPGMNGYEVARRLKENPALKNIPIIFVSGLHEERNILQGFKFGSVDYIAKPFRINELLARVETHLKLYRTQQELELYSNHLEKLVHQQVSKLTEAYKATIFAMAKLAEYRDDNTGHHIERVRLYVKTLAQQLAEKSPYKDVITDTFIERIFEASPLHDIGKIAIPDAILLKPGRLTPEEMDIMKLHTVIGASVLKDVYSKHTSNEFVAMSIEIAMSHHERWDGKGYPEGLKGEQIPLPARIVALADVYDALRSKRPYKDPMSHEKALEIIQSEKGGHFDPHVVDAFLEKHTVIEEISETLKNGYNHVVLGNLADAFKRA
ncbi:MAG: two-component system response regulator [Thermodesulforhabdaceae bacterium]